MKPVKLSPMQAYIIRGARDHIVNGRHTKRVVYVRGSKLQTWCKLYDLGLISAPHEYADLTAEGVAAQQVLAADFTAKVVPAEDGRKGGRPHRFDEVPAIGYAVRVTNANGSQAITLPSRTTMGEAVAAYTEQLKSATEGELVELLGDGESLRMRRKVTVEPRPVSLGEDQLAEAARLRTEAIQRVAQGLDVPSEVIEGLKQAEAERSRVVAAWVAAGRLPEKFPDVVTMQAFVAAALDAWPLGARVTAMVEDTQRTGRIVDTPRYVEIVGHENYGRLYTDVMWDEVPNSRGHYPSRTRPFVDEVTRL